MFFCDGCIQYDRLKKLTQIVGKQRLVLDVSCRKIDEGYCIMTESLAEVYKGSSYTAIIGGVVCIL